MPRLQPADALRIPFGLIIGWIGAVGLWKGIASASAAPSSLFIAALALIFGLAFLAIAFVMTFGWLWARKR